jgi:hypothetical protein
MLNYMHIAGSFLPEISAFDFEVSRGKLKRYASPGSDHFPGDVFQARGNAF